jgi:hypothetical protein
MSLCQWSTGQQQWQPRYQLRGQLEDNADNPVSEAEEDNLYDWGYVDKHDDSNAVQVDGQLHVVAEAEEGNEDDQPINKYNKEDDAPL